jgi:hypothetical protein
MILFRYWPYRIVRKRMMLKKSGSRSDQTGFVIVKKRSDPEHTMLGGWSHNEEFQFPCWSQCCGSKSIFFVIGFGSRIFFSDSDSRANILTRDFLNGVSHCFQMCSGTCTPEKKVFQQKNLCFFLSSVWSAFFHNFFYFTIVSRSESESKSELFSDSDSDPAKIYWVFRIRIHNTGWSCVFFLLKLLLEPHQNCMYTVRNRFGKKENRIGGLFLLPLDRSEVPTLMEPVRLLLKFRFHIDIFQLLLQQKWLRTLGWRSPKLGQFLSFCSAKVNSLC